MLNTFLKIHLVTHPLFVSLVLSDTAPRSQKNSPSILKQIILLIQKTKPNLKTFTPRATHRRADLGDSGPPAPSNSPGEAPAGRGAPFPPFQRWQQISLASRECPGPPRRGTRSPPPRGGTLTAPRRGDPSLRKGTPQPNFLPRSEPHPLVRDKPRLRTTASPPLNSRLPEHSRTLGWAGPGQTSPLLPRTHYRAACRRRPRGKGSGGAVTFPRQMWQVMGSVRDSVTLGPCCAIAAARPARPGPASTEVPRAGGNSGSGGGGGSPPPAPLRQAGEAKPPPGGGEAARVFAALPRRGGGSRSLRVALPPGGWYSPRFLPPTAPATERPDLGAGAGGCARWGTLRPSQASPVCGPEEVPVGAREVFGLGTAFLRGLTVPRGELGEKGPGSGRAMRLQGLSPYKPTRHAGFIVLN